MLNVNVDTYTLRARFQPALLVVLPLGLLALAWIPGGPSGWKLVWGLIVGSGGIGLLSQVGRDWGRRKQDRLFQSWGGTPTTRLLRHRDTTNSVTLARRHRKLQELLPELHIPTKEEEQEFPEAADEVYEACVTYLRATTRDRKKFPLVFEENVNYGFRRNLWAMKPVGIAATVLGIAGTASVIGIIYLSSGTATLPIPITVGVLNVALLIGWIFLFTSTWVKTVAQAYAERLLEASENL